jgi:pimeloyl-ACP methyl ester carboxylesterase
MSHPVQTRPVAVFVHGFGSSRTCWTCAGEPERGRRRAAKRVADFVASDAAFADWDLDFFEYDTRFFSLRPTRQIPTIFEIGEKLRTWLRARGYHQRPTTLIGHSQGGLVILSYLWNVLDEKEAPALGHVRQVLLIATPQKGSALLLGARTALGRLLRNAQEIRLRPLDQSVDALLARTTRDILLAATRDESDRWPVPVRAFYGASDGVVLKESARGELDPSALDSLPGDHSSVLQPEGPDDARYLAIRNALLRPIGHRKVFLIERYDTRITVRPADTTFDMPFKNRSGALPVRSVCDLERSVTFADRNLCEQRFRLRYRTLAADGCLTYRADGRSGRGEISPSDLQGYRDEGRQINFYYRPRKGLADDCRLDVRIYNGFNPGNTNAHFHLQLLDEPLRSIETLEYTLDLTAYLEQGVDVGEPALYWYPHNPAVCDELCGARIDRYRRDPLVEPERPGVWRWSLSHVEGGVVDITWDVPR